MSVLSPAHAVNVRKTSRQLTKIPKLVQLRKTLVNGESHLNSEPHLNSIHDEPHLPETGSTFNHVDPPMRYHFY